MALHAFTHCDTTSAFKGKGKVNPIKVMQKLPKYQPILADLGKEWKVTDELFDGLEAFTCAIYSRPKFKSVNSLRYALIKQKCCDDDRLHLGRNVDLATLPPSLGALKQHIRRVNFQVAIWRRVDTPVVEVPSPNDGHGWTVSSAGDLEPLWVDGPVLPEVLVDELEKLDIDTDDESDNEEFPLISSGSDDSEWES